jgi:hypothetical protein
MPPFAGQGMCSGLRDAANLSWKLDRVLRGESDVALLDSYTSERSVHIQHAVAMSVELGRVICVLDEQQAAERDARMVAGGADPARVLPVSVLPVLGEGVTADAGDVVALRGVLTPQFPVLREGRLDLFDEVTGFGAVLLIHGGDQRVAAQLDPALLEDAGIQVLTIAADGEADLYDPTNLWTQWFDSRGITCVLIRPDHYVFGALACNDDVAALVGQYRARIRAITSRTTIARTPESATTSA